jgi:hypothetical protein
MKDLKYYPVRSCKQIYSLRFQVLAVVCVKTTAFWDVSCVVLLELTDVYEVRTAS